jgi:hypothetical protein
MFWAKNPSSPFTKWREREINARRKYFFIDFVL